MKWIVVDVEADGPCPGLYSMVSLGAVVVEPGEARSFYAQFEPLEGAKWDPRALAVSGITREQHLAYPNPDDEMQRFADWLKEVSPNQNPIFVSDNLAFDWQWVNYYFHLCCHENPFGFSGRRIGDLYSGLIRDLRGGSKWKKLRQTKHTHNPVDDARGNVEALLAIFSRFGLEMPR